MSESATDRYWESQVAKFGPNALPGTAGVDWEAALEQEQAAADPGHGQDEAYAQGYVDGAEQSYELPAEPTPPDPFSDNYADEFEQYLDGRDEQAFEEPDPNDPYSSHEAWFEHNRAQREAQAEQQLRDSDQQLAEQLPQHIAAALGNGHGSAEAAQMLMPAVQALAEQTAEELITGLKAEGYNDEQAMALLTPHYDSLIKSTVATVRQAYGTQRAFTESAAANFPNARRP